LDSTYHYAALKEPSEKGSFQMEPIQFGKFDTN